MAWNISPEQYDAYIGYDQPDPDEGREEYEEEQAALDLEHEYQQWADFTRRQQERAAASGVVYQREEEKEMR